MKEKSKLYRRLVLLSLLRVLVTVAPLGIVLIVNRGQYFTAPGQNVKLTIGGMLCLAMLLLAAMGKLKMPRRVTGVAIALLLSWLFAAIIKDLTLLLTMWLVGEVLDMIVAPFARRAAEDITIGRAASVTATAVSEAIGGSGRV